MLWLNVPLFLPLLLLNSSIQQRTNSGNLVKISFRNKWVIVFLLTTLKSRGFSLGHHQSKLYVKKLLKQYNCINSSPTKEKLIRQNRFPTPTYQNKVSKYIWKRYEYHKNTSNGYLKAIRQNVYLFKKRSHYFLDQFFSATTFLNTIK